MQFKKRSKITGSPNITPLIDVVFILLIFYMLTSTFQNSEGLHLNLPQANSATQTLENSLKIQIDEGGNIRIHENELSLIDLKNEILNFLKIEPQGQFILQTDQKTPVAALVTAMDAIRINGGENIVLATEKPGITAQ